jgi:hypothetical protein
MLLKTAQKLSSTTFCSKFGVCAYVEYKSAIFLTTLALTHQWPLSIRIEAIVFCFQGSITCSVQGHNSTCIPEEFCFTPIFLFSISAPININTTNLQHALLIIPRK